MDSFDNSLIRALRLQAYGGPEGMTLDTIERPRPAAGQVVVRVGAAGVNALDWKVREGYVRDVFPLALPATLGIELAGRVVAVADDVTAFAVGDRVMGPLAGLGAYADEVAVAAQKLARTPDGLDDVRAAAIPVATLTGWQSLFDAGELKAGQTVLVHGASGGVGGYAVQFARRAGAHVIASARAANAGYVSGLGAHEVIDYQRSTLAELAGRVDLVLDLVGGPVTDASWALVSATGRVVSTASPDIVARTPSGQRGIWFQMRPDAARLAEIAGQVASGELKAEVSEVVGPQDGAAAIERNRTGHGRGKAVIRF